AAEPVKSISGIVKDETGRPLEGVKVQVGRMESFEDGRWVHVAELGEMPWETTDKDGRFSLEIGDNIRYDLWFDKQDFAPTFLYEVKANSKPIRVTLKRGMIVTGTVERFVGDKKRPVEGVKVGGRQTSDLRDLATGHSSRGGEGSCDFSLRVKHIKSEELVPQTHCIGGACISGSGRTSRNRETTPFDFWRTHTIFLGVAYGAAHQDTEYQRHPSKHHSLPKAGATGIGTSTSERLVANVGT
ncbi:MAG: carboxypeptidase-like regulatory domain-containing protein, partial [Phycisphaerales bacterium]|nr:carboxypeptidase-like regulatory domain-containing protein [Phycisphaerales bacterium]